MTSTNVPSSRSSLTVWATVRRSKPSTRPKGLPTQFPTHNTVLHRHIQRIAEHLAGFLKAHAMLASVGEILSLVPLEPNTFHAVSVIINL